MDLTDEQWEVLKPIIPVPPRRADGRGRPWRDPRAVLNGMLWILRTGAPWTDVPPRYPPSHTCHRRFQLWVCSTTSFGLWLPISTSGAGSIGRNASSTAPL
jgi:transposase